MPDGQGSYQDGQISLIEQQRSFWLTLKPVTRSPTERLDCAKSLRAFADLLEGDVPFIANDENARGNTRWTRAAISEECLAKDEAVIDYPSLSGSSQVFKQIYAGYITVFPDRWFDVRRDEGSLLTYTFSTRMYIKPDVMGYSIQHGSCLHVDEGFSNEAAAAQNLAAARPRTRSKAPNEVFVYGEANATCGEYVQSIESERKSRPPTAKPTQVYDRSFMVFAGVVDGFLTAENFENPNVTVVSADLWGRMMWLENYCRGHPLEAFPHAIRQLRTYLESTSR
jgi:hypothetical protein